MKLGGCGGVSPAQTFTFDFEEQEGRDGRRDCHTKDKGGGGVRLPPPMFVKDRRRGGNPLPIFVREDRLGLVGIFAKDRKRGGVQTPPLSSSKIG